MTFDEQNPNFKEHDSLVFDGDEYVYMQDANFCWNCRRLTHFYSISFMAPLCSEACATEKWNEYIDATRRKE